jgi:hypothetical protein
METPEIGLSGSERDTLRSLAYGREAGVALDWLAVQRLKRFGLVEETDLGPKITADGKRTIASEAIKPRRE